MDERGVNIDIVFRNGLKDYEVLPPYEVWDKIEPIIRNRQRPLIIFRAAAIIAVVLSLSFLTYRWSRELSLPVEEQLQAQNTESAITPSSDVTSLQPGIYNRGRDLLLADASVSSDQSESINADRNVPAISSIEDLFVSGFLPVNEQPLAEKPEDTGTDNYSAISIETGTTLLPAITEDTEQDKPGRWSITALVAPSYHNRISSGNNETMAQVMATEKPLVSYTGGISLAYRINRRLSVQSGVYYSMVGQELSGISSYSGLNKVENTKGYNIEVYTASGTVYTSNPDIFLLDNFQGERVQTSNIVDPEKAGLEFIDNSLRQNFSYLELPLVVRYKIIDKTLDLNLIGGVSSGMLVDNSVSSGPVGRKYEIGGTEGLNNITFSSSLGMGLEYNFSEKLSLNFEPTVKYYISPFGEIPGMKIHPYSLGIFSGFSYKF